MPIWDLQSARKRLCAIFLCERVLRQLFCVCWIYMYLKNKNHARTSCDNLMPSRERVKLWKWEKSLFQSKVEASTFFITACCENFFFFIEKPVQQKTISCDVIFFFLFAVDLIVYASWDIPSFCILWIGSLWLRCYTCIYARYIKVEFLYTSMWCHLYNNITLLVINGRKSFFCTYVSALYVYVIHIMHLFIHYM